MTPKEVDRELLSAYLEGSCSPAQLRLIREYLHDEVYRDSLHRFMEEEWVSQGRAELPPLPGMEERYARFRAVHKAPVSRKPRIRMIRWMAAAAILVFCLVGFWLLPGLSKRQGSSMQWLSWHNGPGRHGVVTLPDSSRVYLGPASTLWYSQSNDSGRLVRLEGEAYFIVRHDGQRPFTVETGALSTVDIGTEFDIRYYPAGPDIEVAVASGKVQVHQLKLNGHDAGLASTLSPGQLLQYNMATGRSGIRSLSNAALIGAWRNGILSFRQQSLKEVTGELERFYGVRFQYANPAAEKILITTLLDNKSLEDALDIVSLTAGVEFTRQGSLVLVK